MPTATDPTTELIEAGRAALNPTPVKPGVPSWLGSLVRKKFGLKNLGHSNAMILDEALRTLRVPTDEINDDWLDHRGKTVIDGRECFVSEPYVKDLLMQLKHLDAFCKRLGLEYNVSANSWHFPGSTIRFIIFKPE